MLTIEFLYFAGCPGHQAAFDLLQQVLAREGIQAEVERIEVPGPEAAEEYRFLGSPSIRIDGVDLEGDEVEAAQGYGWRCRYYAESEPGQPKAVPASELIRRQLLQHARKNGGHERGE